MIVRIKDYSGQVPAIKDLEFLFGDRRGDDFLTLALSDSDKGIDEQRRTVRFVATDDSGDGRPMYQPPTAGFPLQIAGFPAVEAEVMPDTNESAISTKFVAFGSLRAWGMLGQRRGMTLQRSDEVKFLEGQITIMATARQDIQEAVGEAMAVLKTAAA